MKKLRIAIIGAGWVALHRHVPAIRAQGNADLVGIIDRKPERAKQAADLHRIPNWAESNDLSSIPWLRDVDAVAIATAPFTHASLAIHCLEAGKHVLTEKPFAMNTTEANAMLNAAAAAKRQLSVVHNFQFSDAFKRALRDLESGALGRLLAVEATQFSNPRRRLPEWYQQLRGGLFFDESPHLLYLMKLLGGTGFELQSAHAVPDAQHSNTPGLLSATLRGANGCPMRLSVNFVAPVSEWQILLCGSERLGIADIFRDIYISLPNDGQHVTRTVLRTSFSATMQHWLGSIRPGLAHVTGRALYGNDELYARFVSSCLSGETPALISAEDGASVLAMQHRILDSAGWK